MKVLLCSVGLSPQVVTEALFALRVQGWQPDRLILLTTAEGAAACERLLFGEAGGLAFYCLAMDEHLPDAEMIIAPSENGDMDAGRALASFADIANSLVADICSDPGTELSVLISGGRKPVAGYLALILALHARPDDRLLHVLTQPDMAQVPEFWFPTSRQLALPFGRALDASTVKVQLVEIPFPRFARISAGGEGGYVEAVTNLGAALAPRLGFRGSTICWDGTPLTIPAHLAAWLRWLAAEMPQGIPRVGADRDDYLSHYRRFVGIRSVSAARRRLANPLDPEWIEEKVSRLVKLGRACGMTPRRGSLVMRSGEPGHARYHLALHAGDIDLDTGASP